MDVFGLCVFAFLSFIVPVFSGYTEYDVDRMCGTLIDMTSENVYGVKLTMYVSNVISSNSNCNVTLLGRQDQPYLHYFLHDVSLDNCADTKLDVLSGNTPQTLRLISVFCGSSVESQVDESFTTPDNYLRFSLQLGQNVQAGRVYTILVNTYSEGTSCSSGFTCDNDFCISKTLQCQGNNPCSDKSDCDTDSSTDDEINLGNIGYSAIGIVIMIVFICFTSKSARGRVLDRCGNCIRSCCSTCKSCTSCVGDACVDCCNCCRETGAAGIQRSRDCCSSMRSRCEQCNIRTHAGCKIISCKCCNDETVSPTPDQTTESQQPAQTPSAPPITTEPEPLAPPPSYTEAVGIAPWSVVLDMNNPYTDSPPDYEAAMAQNSDRNKRSK